MRVISGTARSLKLKTLEGLDTRPTQDRIKETLFNMIQNSIPSSTFLDLYSGSGAIGIEALSRGADKAYFIENNQKACDMIKENLQFTKLLDNATILKQDVNSALSSINEKEVSIIFMDPPYQMQLEKETLKKLAKCSFVTNETLIIVEASLDTDFSYVSEMNFEIIKEKRYKTNKHVYLQKSLGGE